MTEIRLYFEGDAQLRPGFRKFFGVLDEKAKEKGLSLRLISTGGTPDRDYAKGRRANPEAWNILLKDSERPDDDNLSLDFFWMVHMMEAWFHADKAALKKYYGKGFNEGALKANPNVEQILKNDLTNGLKEATRATGKGKYHKTNHAPDLLERIDPALVRKAARNCERLFFTVLAKLEQPR